MIESDAYYNAIRTLAQLITAHTYNLRGDEYEMQRAFELEQIYENIDNAIFEMREAEAADGT